MLRTEQDDLSPALDPEWDLLIRDSPQGTSFLRSDWLRMLQETANGGIIVRRFLVRHENGKVLAGWATPMQRIAGMWLSHDFEYFYAGPVLASTLESNPVHQTALRWQVLTELAASVSRNLGLIVAESHPSLSDVRPILRGPFQVIPVFTHRWSIEHLEGTWKRMNREKRRSIRRAKERLQFLHDDDPVALDHFLRLYRLNVARFGQAPTQQWEAVFRERWTWMQQHRGARLYVVRDQHAEILAAVLLLTSEDDHEGYLWRVGFGEPAARSGALPALYWSVAQALNTDSFTWKWLNLGGSPNPSLHQFKDYLGAFPTLHFRFIHRHRDPRVLLWAAQEQARIIVRRVRLYANR